MFAHTRCLDERGNLVLDLGDTVRKMKQDFGVEQVLAWHAMAGYWAGVEPTAPEMAPFDPRVTELLAPKGIREVDPEVGRPDGNLARLCSLFADACWVRRNTRCLSRHTAHRDRSFRSSMFPQTNNHPFVHGRGVSKGMSEINVGEQQSDTSTNVSNLSLPSPFTCSIGPPPANLG